MTPIPNGGGEGGGARNGTLIAGRGREEGWDGGGGKRDGMSILVLLCGCMSGEKSALNDVPVCI